MTVLSGAAIRGNVVAMKRKLILQNAAYFNSHRMMRRYATEPYLG
ncbi:MAG TPA: hypothetical protein VN750_26085 [Steroidobacteraceae bacterium]|nr:hypothetical protein [Steroidobacteraceae bacterium]